MSGGDSCRQLGGWVGPGSAAWIVVGIVWAPARVALKLPPRPSSRGAGCATGVGAGARAGAGAAGCSVG